MSNINDIINVVSWTSALRNNFSPCDYTFNPDEIPVGTITVRLDCKIWAKQVMAINCYFTATDYDKKFQLTVFCNFKNGTYKLPGSAINFATCPLNNEYDIDIRCGPHKRITMFTASSHLSNNI